MLIDPSDFSGLSPEEIKSGFESPVVPKEKLFVRAKTGVFLWSYLRGEYIPAPMSPLSLPGSAEFAKAQYSAFDGIWKSTCSAAGYSFFCEFFFDGKWRLSRIYHPLSSVACPFCGLSSPIACPAFALPSAKRWLLEQALRSNGFLALVKKNREERLRLALKGAFSLKFLEG